MGLGGGGVVAGREARGESATTGVGGGSANTGGGSATGDGRTVSAGAGTVGTGTGGGPAVATVAAPAGRDSVRTPAAASQRNRSPNTRGTQSVSQTSGRKSVSRAWNGSSTSTHVFVPMRTKGELSAKTNPAPSSTTVARAPSTTTASPSAFAISGAATATPCSRLSGTLISPRGVAMRRLSPPPAPSRSNSAGTISGVP